MAKNIWIAVPAYTGQVHLGTVRSLMTDMVLLAERADRVTGARASSRRLQGLLRPHRL